MNKRVLVALWLLALSQPWVHAAEAQHLRVAVLEDVPPMSYRRSDGVLTGFSVAIMRAVCDEMRFVCTFEPITLDRVIGVLVDGHFDVAAVSLLSTPERQRQIIFAKPHFRSVSLWFARPGVQPGQAGIRVAVLRDSAQALFAVKKGWETVTVQRSADLIEPLRVGLAQAAIIPMSTAMGLMKRDDFQGLALTQTVMEEAELGGDVSFGISPHRPDLKPRIDVALDRIKRNGVYDRINSQFLPFRVN